MLAARFIISIVFSLVVSQGSALWSGSVHRTCSEDKELIQGKCYSKILQGMSPLESHAKPAAMVLAMKTTKIAEKHTGMNAEGAKKEASMLWMQLAWLLGMLHMSLE